MELAYREYAPGKVIVQVPYAFRHDLGEFGATATESGSLPSTYGGLSWFLRRELKVDHVEMRTGVDPRFIVAAKARGEIRQETARSRTVARAQA